MPDKTALPNADILAENPTLELSEEDKAGVGESVSDTRQTIFDQRFAALTDGFGAACEQAGVNTAVAIALHPDEQHPIVFIRGHEYDVAALLATILRRLKVDLYTRLSGEPR